MKVAFNDLLTGYRDIQGRLDRAITRVMRRGQYVLGPEVQEFECAFAEYTGTRYAAGCASGTEAITLVLMSLKKKGEVITQANTCIPTIAGIVAAGCIPRLVDVEEGSFVIDAAQVRRAVTKKTCAILPVHLYGRPNITDGLMNVSRECEVPIIEDCAQSHGALWRGKKTGSIGAAGCFSFYPTKNLGCYGDGGAVTTNSKKLYADLLKLRNYGQKTRYLSDSFGINSRLDEVQAALLKEKLRYLDKWNCRRTKICDLYDRLIEAPQVRKLTNPEHTISARHLYVILCEKRDELQNYLANKGVQTIIHYPVPVHMQKAYNSLGYRKGEFPVSEKAARSLLSLPLYPGLSDAAVAYISGAVNDFYKGML